MALADDGEVLRRGTEQTLVFDRDNDYEVGTPVTWYVNGEEVAQTEVGEDGKITLGLHARSVRTNVRASKNRHKVHHKRHDVRGSA